MAALPIHGASLLFLRMPPNASLHGVAVDHLMLWNLAALLPCFVAAQAWIIFAMVRRKKAAVLKTYSHLVERLLLAAFCAMYLWMAITAQHLWAVNRFEGASAESMQVEVVGQQFQWYFRYPGADAAFGIARPSLVNAAAGNPLGLDPQDARGADDIVSSVLVLPLGREVDLRLRSLDVIHGFFIPAMRLKENTVPGLVLHVHFTPIAVGTYPILCSQVCGSGHARMQAQLRVVSPDAYRQWLQQHAKEHSR
ncbi:cytochrome c oxidase subunit 2 [Silvibacterium bohemicum]|uniref:cytochrome-c oxidase n=1 Tax=Silvibacterium bohemicum TaxID=1577686 RepID=A0A841K217_9BACT|nr:cytochrome c oxidase subunit II [Silvibacterium bohemicum]MBB6146637.1 cytochrome c oxidase subunit 2 [Silvibacterium bohemicum]